MSTPPRPRLKSLPTATDQPSSAEPAPTPSGSGAPKVVAEGVPSAVLPDPQQGDGRYPIAWLRITAPKGATPTAHSWCMCDRDLFAAGHARVLALIEDHTAHRDLCTLRASQEERNAA
ncbi:hypothetical protein ACFRCX_13155 [Streptomyces sp. NPDC056652]|uniref:hypothetical protein n=1 Tax=Streptomyces sp. NPDC056652 TaxID=3345893 RepID=UPI0036C07C98